jgi:predicted DNA-binding ribbon-helix-helix protein
MYKESVMVRTQIYFEEETLKDLKNISKSLDISVSEFIRKVVKKELKVNKKDNLSDFLNTLEPLDSFKNIDATDYVNDLRSKSRLLNG